MSLGGFIEKPLSFDCYCTRGQSFAALLRIPTLSSSIRWLVEMAGVESGQEAKGVKGEQWTKRLPAWRRKTRRKVARRTAIVVHRWIGTRLTFQGYRTFDNCESFIPLKFQLDSNGLVALQHKENSLPRSGSRGFWQMMRQSYYICSWVVDDSKSWLARAIGLILVSPALVITPFLDHPRISFFAGWKLMRIWFSFRLRLSFSIKN